MAKVTYEFKTGSKNWEALFNGQISGKELFDREYFGPIAVEVEKSINESGLTVKKLLEDTVTGWNDPPTFVIDARVNVRNINMASAEVVFLVTGDGAKNWLRIDRGTPKHRIPKAGKNPIRPMPMRPYAASTSPGSGLPKSIGRGVHGYPESFRQSVVQSIRARDFQGRISEYMRTDPNGFKGNLRKAIARAKTRIARNG